MRGLLLEDIMRLTKPVSEEARILLGEDTAVSSVSVNTVFTDNGEETQINLFRANGGRDLTLGDLRKVVKPVSGNAKIFIYDNQEVNTVVIKTVLCEDGENIIVKLERTEY